MSTRNWAFYVRILPIALFAVVYGLNANAQGRFIQNMGQWDHRAYSRASVKSGAIFLCKNQVRYSFLNAKDVESFHADPYRIDTSTVHGQAFFLDWINANANSETVYQNQYPEYYNYYIGNDPSQWKSGVNAYSDFTYKNLYPGIDLALSAEGSDLEYTYTIQPGADPLSIKIKIKGAESVSVKDGDLCINSQLIKITEKSPNAYQFINEEKVAVPCVFKISNGSIESFEFPKGYDKTKTLIIDPVVVFSTYSGSTVDNWGFTATYDSIGDGYSGGVVFGTGFPTTSGAFQQKFAGGTNYYLSSNPKNIDLEVVGYTARDVGILKYAPDGKSLIYATYLGGKKGNEQPHSMVVDKSNNLVVMGTTASSDFPVTSNAYSKTLGGETDLFVSKFSADGTKLLASTFVGGSGFDGVNGIDSQPVIHNYYVPYATTKLVYNYGDQFRGEVVTDPSNNVYVASSSMSSNFPTTSGSFQPHFGGGKQDGVAFKLDSNLHNLVWSTFLGGNQDDAAYSIQVDKKQNAFVCGGTLSPYFFPSGSSYQKSLAGDVDGYICHIKSDGSGIIRATYFGTSKYDQTYFVQLDQSENVYVYGQTESVSFPVKNVSYSNPKSGNFITKFNNGLDSMIFSTVFGSGKGKPDISPTAFLVDNCNKVYISGWGGELFYPTLSRLQYVYNMPITSGAFQSSTPDSAAFYVAVFEKNLDTLLYSSYFGAATEVHVDGGTSRFDKNGIMYQSVCAGCGGTSDFPTTPGAWSRTNNSTNCNNLLFKVNLEIPTLKAGFEAPLYTCYNVPIIFKNTSIRAVSYLWDFGDGSPKSILESPSHSYSNPGKYLTSLVAINPNSCVVRDSITRTIVVYQKAKASYAALEDTCSRTIKLNQTGESNTASWSFGDGGYSDSMTVTHIYSSPGNYVVKLLVDSGTSCVDTFSRALKVTGMRADFSYSPAVCNPQKINFINSSSGDAKSFKWYINGSLKDTTKKPSIHFDTSGNYNIGLLAIDSIGCKDSVSKSITVYKTPKAAFSDTIYPCSGKVFVQNKSTGISRFKWYFSDGTTASADSVLHQFPRDTSVDITLVTDSGSVCPDTIKRTLKTNLPKAGYAYFIDTCTGQVLFSNTSIGGASYTWKFDSKDSGIGKNGIFTYKTKGQYPVKLSVVSSSGCTDTITQDINIANSIQKLFIPNVFTPNGDQYNNTFTITGLNPCNKYDLSIYNRWGQLFYHSEGNSFTWDGIINGVKVPEGVYYYVFHGKAEGELKGAVTVIY